MQTRVKHAKQVSNDVLMLFEFEVMSSELNWSRFAVGLHLVSLDTDKIENEKCLLYERTSVSF